MNYTRKEEEEEEEQEEEEGEEKEEEKEEEEQEEQEEEEEEQEEEEQEEEEQEAAVSVFRDAAVEVHKKKLPLNSMSPLVNVCFFFLSIFVLLSGVHIHDEVATALIRLRSQVF